MHKKFIKRFKIFLVFATLHACIWTTGRFANNFGDNLEGWWKFDDSSDFPTDSSYAANHATLVGDVHYTSEGLVGGALEFGPSGLLEIPHHPGLTPEVGTIQVWINIPYLQDAYLFLQLSNRLIRTQPETPVGIGVYIMRITQGGHILSFVADDDPDHGTWRAIWSEQKVLSPNTWHLLGMRWDGSNFTIFADGVPVSSTAYSPIPEKGLSFSGNYPLHFAKDLYNPFVGHFVGKMDEIRIYSRALSDREMFAEYKSKGHKPARANKK